MAHLDRFIEAQRGVIDTVLAELAAGRKASHWMWFIFPQIEGLGSSPTARAYAIRSEAEARAYLAHPVLGERLRACTRLVLGHAGRTADAIFGGLDAMKFRSSMTLFAECAPRDSVFNEALEAFFAGEPDRRTLELLQAALPG